MHFGEIFFYVKYRRLWRSWCYKKVRGFVGRICGSLFLDWLGELFNHIKYTVGNGTKISFWLGIWCEDTTLKNVYPSLFIIASDQEATVVETPLFWNVNFIRDMHDWELGSEQCFWFFLKDYTTWRLHVCSRYVLEILDFQVAPFIRC